MRRLVKFGIILIGALSFFVSGTDKTEAAEWKLFQATSAGNIYYYDPTSVKHFSNDIFRVWVRIIETQGFSKRELEGLKDPKKGMGVVKKAERRSTGEWKQLFEIDCTGRMIRVLSATLYDTKGITKEDYEIPSDWVQIAPDSVTNYLSEILCR